MSRYRFCLLLFLACAVVGAAAWSEEKAGRGNGDVLPINTSGRPVLGPKKAQGPRYLIWHADGQWHLRTRASTEIFTFRGTITVQEGKFAKIENYDDLENKRRRKKPQDVGKLNAARDRIAFEFRTSTAEDGFDFTPGPGATALEFDLKIDDQPAPEKVYLGKKASNPPRGKFLLAANPSEDKAR